MSQEQAKQKIGELIKKYEEVLKSGEAKKYTEEETKKDFILPLFEALGWDVFNKKEVSAEEHIKSSGRVDYGFYINGRTKFYLEAKPLKADLNDEDFAKQAIRYSWNRGVTWAILTNFESVKVFNAQAISKYLGDKLYFEIPYSEFLERFDQLRQLSKDEFGHDLIDKEAERVGKKLQKVSITSLLYKDLNEGREILTKGFTLWNKHLDKDLLDEGVQRLLDRLIFIRVAEDRGIEPPTLQPLLREWKAGPRKEPFFKSLISKFRELDATYNSNLFSPHPFEDWEEYDNVTEEAIDIFYGKPGYYEYDFKAIPADVLGTVYENYLGYRLAQSKKELTIAKDAKKRKEQGIYYTPSFIVDYIVRNALGPVLDKCRSIEDLKKIKVLDPACGSGSFLIKALEVIGDKYKEFNRLVDTNTKIQIIIENLYGVDLDEQAVEIARLNLMISALDNRVLFPSLSNNIKNGNSLISGTDEELKKYFGKNYRDKKPFNWQEEFPDVFKRGGFDVVIGNPPYVNIANIKDANERDYLKENFETAKNKSDLYSFFTERAVGLLRDGSTLGFIFSNSWLGTESFSRFREFLVDNTTVTELVRLPPDVFAGATVTTVLIFLQKKKAPEDHKVKLLEYVDAKFTELSAGLSYARIKESPGFSFSFGEEVSFNVPIIKLGDMARFSLGIKTSDDKKFILDEKKNEDSYKLLRGKDVNRYFYQYAGKWIWYKPDLMMQKVGAGPRRIEYFLREKLLFRSITGGSIIATFDDEMFLTNDKVHILYDSRDYPLKFILGIVNSKIIGRWIRSTFNDLLEIKINQLEHVPIPKVSKEKQMKVVKLVDNILQLNKKLQLATENSNEWHKLKSEVTKTDHKIDEEVYKLYGLTPEEIKIVEGNNK